jgi:uncharacterized protein
MESCVFDKRTQVEALCRRFQVERLELFGSSLRRDFRFEESDLDFLVVFPTEASEGYADRFFGLKEGLEALFGRPVDLISASAVSNPYFREGIERSRALLYAA